MMGDEDSRVDSTSRQPAPTAPLGSSAVGTRLIIQGITIEGRAFRPSDWAERLCGVISTFGGDQHMRYSPYMRPIMLDGVRCVIVDSLLNEFEPKAHQFLINFAKDNRLLIIDPAQMLAEDYCPLPGIFISNLV
jgi:Protein of unknown function (DUF3579)